MSESGCQPAAWIRGILIFISSILFLSACSDDDQAVAPQTQQLDRQSSQGLNSNVIQRAEIKKQHPPFSQLILGNISIDYPYSPSRDFKLFIKKISRQASLKNFLALQNNVSPLFNCTGKSCKEGYPIAEQFIAIIASLGKHPEKALKNMIDTKYYQQINGNICGPANFVFNGAEQDRTSSQGWGYINGKSVRLRKKASVRSGIITHLSHTPARQISAIMPIKKGMQWVNIETLKGQKGFVAKKYFLPLKSKQMCYQKIAGEWKISAFRDPTN